MTLAWLLAAALPAAAWAGETPAWKGSAELSFVSANGNSSAQTSSAKAGGTRRLGDRDALELEAGGLGSRGAGAVTAERYFAGEKLSRKLDERNYVFQRYRWDRDRFAGVAHRHDISLGAGRELWKTPRDLLSAELAPGYLNEERLRDRRKSFASARAAAKYARELGAGSRFTQDAEWTQGLADSRDARLATETSLSAALSSSLAVKNSFSWKRDNRPPRGARKDDTLLSVALVATF